MSVEYVNVNDLKRRIRKLKRFERTIRFGGGEGPGAALVWDDYFDLRETSAGKAKYTLSMLTAMSREEYRNLLDEYFAFVYYEYYKENGITAEVTYEPGLLAQLDLPFNADIKDIKGRFRKLAKEYHPDTGGTPEKFIELMKIYEKLLGR